MCYTKTGSDHMDFERILTHFLPFAKTLNNNHIKWALGGSLLLALEGYDTIVNDVDILVSKDDEERLLQVIDGLRYKKKYPRFPYKTEIMYTVYLEQISIDIMINFKVDTPDGVHSFIFTTDTPVTSIQITKTTIYKSSIEEWKQAYMAIRRDQKVHLIEKGPSKNPYKV